MTGLRRARRVGDRIREELSYLLLRKVKDPRIGFVTITQVVVSPNLRLAKVYYSVYGTDEDKKRVKEGLDRALGFIKRELSHRLELKYMPELVFHYDRSLEDGSRMEELFRKLRQKEGDYGIEDTGDH